MDCHAPRRCLFLSSLIALVHPLRTNCTPAEAMSEVNWDTPETVNIGMYESETGGVEGSGFHTFNVSPTQYHRAEGLVRTGAVNISCALEKVVHGILDAESDRYATLIVMQWHLQPTGTRRISQASIELQFSDGRDGDGIELEKMSFNDTYSLLPTTRGESVTEGGEATVGVDQFASLSANAKWEKTVTQTTSHAITLAGYMDVANNRPPFRVARWTLAENPSQHGGVPASLKVATLVSRDSRDPFFCDLRFTCKTDWATSVQGLFKKIPKDDPIIFQPDPDDRGMRPNKHVVYGDDELALIDLDSLSDVTFRRVISDGLKPFRK